MLRHLCVRPDLPLQPLSTVLKEDAAAAGVNRDQNGPDLPLRKVPIYPCSQVQVEEMVFYSVHNSALSTYTIALPSTTTPPTQHYYVHYKV